MSNRPSAQPPLVTFAIAAYNAGQYLVPSVRSALNQTHERLEVIVVDDGSTDGSVDALMRLDDPRLTVIRQRNQGKSVALNKIRSVAEGDYLVVHDGDDQSHPDRVSTQLAAMEANPRLGACFSRHDLLLGERRFAARRLSVDEHEFAAYIEQMKIPAIDPTGMYRTSFTQDIDYEPELRIGQGVDYMLRVGERHPMIVLGQNLYSYRIVADSTTRRSPAKTHEYIERVRRRAAERRDVPYLPHPAPTDGGKAQHAFFGHILEASIENALAGDRLESARIASTTLRYAHLGLDGLKPLAVTVLPSSILRRLRPETDPAKIV